MHNKGCETVPTTEAERKAMKKYREKRKKIACDVDIQLYEKIKTFSELKGFKSLNSYILYLIDKDMKK